MLENINIKKIYILYYTILLIFSFSSVFINGNLIDYFYLFAIISCLFDVLKI